ncbi:TVP38/TMEM64 family protein [Pseudooceanicola aestuarii]|uniref:TVP38/TMEM64 family protein n=1 Tax=Pseudooceanicola aestuarii TaxID=2697319 RepID=UPI0013D32A2F|nr:VTT domain-containing protein [Pseudooceanicola aestuarii]
MSEIATPPDRPAPSRLRRRLPLIAVAVAALLGAFLLRDTLSFDTLARHREALTDFRQDHAVLTALAFIAAYAAIVAFSLPGATVATLTGGFLFGLWPGALFNVLGATLGAVGIFLAVRAGLGDQLAARMNASEGRIRKLKDELDRNQWSMLFLIRLMPVVPFFVANVLPALLSVPLRRFAITTFLGIMPGAVVFTSVGAGLGEVFDRGDTPDLGVVFEPFVLLPLLGLSALALLPVIIRALRGGDVT